MSRLPEDRQTQDRSDPGQDRRSGPLAPIELTEAAVLGGITLALCLAGWFLPGGTGAMILAGLPMAVLGYRHRLRALIAGVIAGSSVVFLLVGSGPVFSVVASGVVGGAAGICRRRGWGVIRVSLVGLGLVPPVALTTDGLLYLFSESRKLTLEQLTNSWKGVVSLLRPFGVFGFPIHVGTVLVSWVVRWWWIGLPVIEVTGMMFGLVITWWFCEPIVTRLEWVQVSPLSQNGGDTDEPRTADPVPARLRDVTVRYPGNNTPALSRLTLDVNRAEMLAVVGPNGSGKSTLIRLLAGTAPTAGTVERAGPVGLGTFGGTSLVFQRPETQVLGVRVADDVVWGLPSGTDVDVDGLLEMVGLKGMRWRDTSGLSGGELQRLAIAAALARRPALLLSDESTAMVDADGRRQLTNLLARLPNETGLSVVHVTHRLEEAARADRTFRLAPLRSSLDKQPPVRPAGVDVVASPGGRLEVSGVNHVWAPRTPWEKHALGPLDLKIDRGSGVLVVGPNGSGKSTLAWVLAGVLRPTSGRCYLDGEPIDERVGAVALSFQHARLQLQRSRVRSDIRAASGVDDAGANQALEMVGLPSDIGNRRVDQLSGGQQRRVALAGLLARRPRAVVLDEPLAGLDDESALSLLEVLGRLRTDNGTTVVVVSHDLDGTETLCDRVVHLDEGVVVDDRPLGPSGPRVSSSGPGVEAAPTPGLEGR